MFENIKIMVEDWDVFVLVFMVEYYHFSCVVILYMESITNNNEFR